MKALRKNARYLLTGLLLVLFFLPAFRGVSGFEFVSLARAEAKASAELGDAEVFVVLLPLLLVPASAAAMLICTLLKVRLNKTILALPVVGIGCFLLLLLINGRHGSGPFSNPWFIFKMQPAFYLAVAAAVALLFSHSPHRKKLKRRSRQEQRELVA